MNVMGHSLSLVKQDEHKGGCKVLQLQTICYIKPVLAFGTEQDIIVNSRVTQVQCFQRSNCLMSVPKSASCKRYCLRKFESKV
jgi:hypothetical protein